MKKPDINKLREALTKLILEGDERYTEILGTGITSINGNNKITIHYDNCVDDFPEDYEVEIEIKEPKYRILRHER